MNDFVVWGRDCDPCCIDEWHEHLIALKQKKIIDCGTMRAKIHVNDNTFFLLDNLSGMAVRDRKQ